MTLGAIKPKHTRYGLWLFVAVIVTLLVVSTWEVARRKDSDTPLKLRRAAFDGDETTVRRLMSLHPEWIDIPGSAPKRKWVRDAIFEKVDKIVNKVPSDYDRDYVEEHFLGLEATGATALVHALIQSKTNIAQFLVEQGAYVQIKLGRGYSLLSHVINTGDTNLLVAFEKRGLSYRSPTLARENDPMLLASWANHPNTMKLFIERGLSVNVAGQQAETPLHVAISRGRLDFVQLIATNGADLHARNARGQTPLALARLGASGNSPKHRVVICSWLEDYASRIKP